MARRLIYPPAEVRDAARKALAAKPLEVPEITYRLASGVAHLADVECIAMWCLDNPEQFDGPKCTVAAALRGGNAGQRWALAAALDDGRQLLIRDQLKATTRSDQQLTSSVAAAIAVAWHRQLDHAARKTNSRLGRTTEGRTVEFLGWPNPRAAQIAGIDDLMDKAWDSFVQSLTLLFGEYARSQVALVAVVDPLGAESVRSAITGRIPAVVNAIAGFLEQRTRDYLTGEIVYPPQEFAAARTIAAWVAGSGGEPTGFAFNELSDGVFAIGFTTAQLAILAAAVSQPERVFLWVHSFYGAPLRPFPPHEQLDGELLTPEDAQRMVLHPGDHIGCRCELIPDWTW